MIFLEDHECVEGEEDPQGEVEEGARETDPSRATPWGVGKWSGNIGMRMELQDGEFEGVGSGLSGRRFLVIYNISKRNNIKDLCWTAAAHQFEVLYVSGSSLEGLNFA